MRLPIPRTLVTLLLLLFAAASNAAPGGPVQTREDTTQIVLDNGIVGLTISKKTGIVTSLRTRLDGHERELGDGTEAMRYDFNNHSGQYVVLGQQGATVSIVSATPDSADVSVTSQPTPACPFVTDIHWILRCGDGGFYTYIIYRHTRGMPACTWEQTRAVIRGVRGSDVFTHYVVDDARKGLAPTGPVRRTVSDTTWLYASESEPRSKYEYTNYIADDLVHGLAGHGIGLWLIAPSREYVNGGPLRQELTVHQDSPTNPPQNNIVLWMLQGNHFGAANLKIAADEEWTRFYGPAFVYTNQAPTVDALWKDARQKALKENARWPYNFVRSPDYPLRRGTVSGQIKLSSQDSLRGAWVVLVSSADNDWCQSSHGYSFWSKADAKGRFKISQVRPGRYTLFVSGGNQFEDFRRPNLRVSEGSNALGNLTWTPITHGRTLWQIGTPDRSTGEFAYGQDYRHYTNYLRYGKNFPNDVTFRIGQSRENRDWNFAQWGWYVKQPYWAVRFDHSPTARNAAAHGTAMLTLSFASFHYPRGLQVRLNGQQVGLVTLPNSGMAPYRAGRQDSLRQTVYLSFDAALLRPGSNELQLALSDAVPFDATSDAKPDEIGAVMYDALRLEVDSARTWKSQP